MSRPPLFELRRVLNRDAAAGDAVGAAAHRVVVQRQCRAHRHGAAIQRGAGDRRSAAMTVNRAGVADGAAVNGVAVQPPAWRQRRS